MQVSLTKCLRIEEDQIASHLAHRSDVDDVIFGKRITPGALDRECPIQFCGGRRLRSPHC